MRQTPELKRYVGRVLCNGVTSGEYVDWFTDDLDAAATYRVIMEEQGYTVLGVQIGNPCIVKVQ